MIDYIVFGEEAQSIYYSAPYITDLKHEYWTLSPLDPTFKALREDYFQATDRYGNYFIDMMS